MAQCTHLNTIEDIAPGTNGCQECLEMGSRWMHLRRCAACGHVGCCDQSPNKHATAHFHTSGHPIIQSFEPDEEWFWCYIDEVGFEIEGAPSYSHSQRRGRR